MRSKTFRKMLIANRGEIAIRIIRTCRKLGIGTTAVYSDADSRAPHTKAADRAVRIGPAPAQQSYLNIDAIIQAAVKSGADAIHPGYGFLSENADFAEACESAGIVFIGPSAEAIRKMGLKSAARRLAAAAGVAVVPGYDGDEQSIAGLGLRGREIGFPLLIKASAGGGGKGMRLVRTASDLEDSLESAAREAEKAFGDSRLLLEKYIDEARHVEIQILGDHRGNMVHLFERDCSIQRRHQKIIEESPSPALNDELRDQMGRAALVVGGAINYSNAGTVEFILAPSGEFYFIEVNTRLQVEHPVTEMITGLDLVELQIELAEGRPLPFSQADVSRRGHAIEARVYAEDAANGFLPAAGTVRHCQMPESDGVRIDAGIETGSEIGIHYDPMLAKIIARGDDRETALRKIRYALTKCEVHGVTTNREFLIRVLDSSEFRDGRYHTGVISDDSGLLAVPEDSEGDLIAGAVVALYRVTERATAAEHLSTIPPAYRNNPYRDPSVKLQIGGRELTVSYAFVAPEFFSVQCGDWRRKIETLQFEPRTIRISIDGEQVSFTVTRDGDRYYVQSDRLFRTVTVLPRYPHRTGALEHESADAPMPGQVLKILVEPGQEVALGDPLIILEAMKMEQTIRAATCGIIEEILVKPGEVVSPGERLITLAGKSLA